MCCQIGGENTETAMAKCGGKALWLPQPDKR
jgi:hypothetical protein